MTRNIGLPLPILKKRLQNEEEELIREGYEFSVDDFIDNPQQFIVYTTSGREEITAVRRYRIKIYARGYEKRNGNIVTRDVHETYIYILRHYPLTLKLPCKSNYECKKMNEKGAPVRFQWITPIFHPNISNGLEAGGHGVVCWALLAKWTPQLNLLGIVKGLASLVENPNPRDALIFPECKEAAKWLLNKG